MSIGLPFAHLKLDLETYKEGRLGVTWARTVQAELMTRNGTDATKTD